MAYKPILFNTEMSRAIRDGIKTQTRRIMKPQARCTVPRDCATCSEWRLDGKTSDACPSTCVTTPEPPVKAGDILWVRETWHKDAGRYMYKANYTKDDKFYRNGKEVSIRWRPSIHMPKEAARTFLLVKDVRVERLQDMDEEAAIAEGFADSPADTDSPLLRFTELWDKTIKRDDLREFGYHANPWVWVIEFKRCEKPEGWPGHG